MTVEEVYVNSYTEEYSTTWTKTGNSPYIQDTDSDYVDTNTNNLYISKFGFPNSEGSGTINSVKLRFEASEIAIDAGEVDIEVLVYDGTTWIGLGWLSVLADGYWHWATDIDVSAILNTWAKINACQVRLRSAISLIASAGVRRCTRKVTYTAVAPLASRRLLVGVGL